VLVPHRNDLTGEMKTYKWPIRIPLTFHRSESFRWRRVWEAAPYERISDFTFLIGNCVIVGWQGRFEYPGVLLGAAMRVKNRFPLYIWSYIG